MAESIDYALSQQRPTYKPPLSFAVGNNSAPTSNTAAVVTIAADAARPIALAQIHYGYSAAPTGGSVKVEDGSGNTVYGPIPISGGGPGVIAFDPPLKGTVNTALIVTLAAGGSGITGALYANAWKIS